ncbi:hypothetical protein OBBRIDRAFT_795097 [Obba rivulosa]|uniref:Uncharacterized protein n=1 Tax=Obba rivulosa TaxID=1052685 RepID=A0A8E2DK66_9APHY|nr:hypothetical protein OBBRIDRAFT_795097 [Obba rivulosa]
MSTMNKPRHSILTLFDPLKTPLTPRRDSSDSPETSDKENDAPPGQMTLFVKRIYDARKQYTPKGLAGTLIDFEDALTEEPLPVATDDEDDVAEDAHTSEGCEEAGRAIWKRQPLVEIDLQHTPKARPRSHTLPSGMAHAVTTEVPLPIQALTAAPIDAPLSDVINSINMTSCSISEPPSSPLSLRSPLSACIYPSFECEDEDQDPFPTITVAPPPPTGIPEEHVITSPIAYSPAPFRDSSLDEPFPRVQRRSPKARMDDPRRMSCDLQSSFNMHLSSADMSFNLLNDRISFLSTEHDSMWAGQEDDFDMKAEEKALNCLVGEQEALQPLIEEGSGLLHSPSSRGDVLPDVPIESNSPLSQEPTLLPLFRVPTQIEKPVVPDFSDEPPFSVDIPEKSRNEQTAVNNPVVTQPPTDSVPQTPSKHNPAVQPLAPAIPSLRVVKKTLKVHGRTEAATTTTARRSSVSVPSYRVATSASVARRSSVSQPARPFLTQAPKRVPTEDGQQTVSSMVPPDPKQSEAVPVRRVIRGVQRPPLPVDAVKAPSKIAATASSVAVRRRETVNPLSRFVAAGVQRPTASTAASQAKPAFPGSTGALRASSVTAAPKVPAMGLKPPMRYSAAGTAIPKPASRLPTPASGVPPTGVGAVKRAVTAKVTAATTDGGKATTLRKRA